MGPGKSTIRPIKPALTAYLKRSQVLLTRADVPDDEAVHDIRVLMKRSRAALKLVSCKIDKDSFDRDYLAYREIGRMLSSIRESSVHRKTIKDLRKRYPDLFKEISDYPGFQQIAQNDDHQGEPVREMNEAIELAGEHLTKASYRLRFLAIDETDASTLLGQLESTFQNALRAFIDCRKDPKQSKIHRFRKRSKDLLYQLWFFRPIDPKGVKALCNKLERITRNIGRSNDLAVLLAHIEKVISGEPEVAAFQGVMLAVRQEQDRYLSRVWPVAYGIFVPGENLSAKIDLKIPGS